MTEQINEHETKSVTEEKIKKKKQEPLSIQTMLSDNRLMVISEELTEDYQYSFALIFEDEEQVRLKYATDHVGYFWLTKPGRYSVKVFAISSENQRREGQSDPVEYKGKTLHIQSRKEKLSIPESIGRLIRELWSYREQTVRLAYFDYRARNKDSKMGKMWDVLHPLIQIFIFWFVFGIGFRSGQPVDGHPYLLWMLCGLTPWFLISSGISSGCSAVFSKANVVLRMQYPLATLPFSTILESFIEHIITIGILLVVGLCYGYYPKFQWLNLLYYQGYTIFALSAFALITSTLTMKARDYQKLIVSLIRLLFYLTPILWSMDRLPEKARAFLTLNPVLYIVEGYRDSLLYGRNFWNKPAEMAFFWLFAISLMGIGAWTHYGNRDSFSDML